MENQFDEKRFPGNFYQGIIVRLERGKGAGVVRSMSGREIPFQFPFVSVVGAPLGGRTPGMQFLKEGARVGFDVGWTSKGLRVTLLKPEDDLPPDEPN
jgi:hypothetical protein